MTKYPYLSAWYSPQGFSNEGSYVYGTRDEIDAFFNQHVAGSVTTVWGSIKEHRWEVTAKARCRKDSRKDNADQILAGYRSSIGFRRV